MRKIALLTLICLMVLHLAACSGGIKKANTELRAQVEELNQENEDLRAKVAELTQENESLLEQVTTYERTEELQSKIKELEQELDRLKR